MHVDVQFKPTLDAAALLDSSPKKVVNNSLCGLRCVRVWPCYAIMLLNSVRKMGLGTYKKGRALTSTLKSHVFSTQTSDGWGALRP